MAKFTLTIALGNEEMQTGDNVAGALDRITYHLRSFGHLTPTAPVLIRDRNGNNVGKWSVTAGCTAWSYPGRSSWDAELLTVTGGRRCVLDAGHHGDHEES